jgi:hypothetical protein
MEMAGLEKEVPRRHSPIWRIAPAFKKVNLDLVLGDGCHNIAISLTGQPMHLGEQ